MGVSNRIIPPSEQLQVRALLVLLSRRRGKHPQSYFDGFQTGYDKRGRHRSAATSRSQRSRENAGKNIAKCGNMCARAKQNTAKCRDSWPFCGNPVCPDPVWKPASLCELSWFSSAADARPTPPWHRPRRSLQVPLCGAAVTTSRREVQS